MKPAVEIMYKAPSIEKLARMMDLVKYVIFPDYSPIPSWTDGAEAVSYTHLTLPTKA